MLLAVATVLGGCAAAIFPTFEHRSETAGTRGEIPERSIAFLHVGSTTRSDVLLALGEPDLAINDDRWFAYRWVMMTGGWFFIVAANSPVGAAGEFDKTYALIMEFDERGVVQRFETKQEKLAGDLLADDLKHW